VDKSVYLIELSADGAEYQLVEIGIKIRRQLASLVDIYTGNISLAYNPVEKFLYLSIPVRSTRIKSKLFVCHMRQIAWTEYNHYNGFYHHLDILTYEDVTNGEQQMAVLCTSISDTNTENNRVWVRIAFTDRYLDLVQTGVGNGSNTLFDVASPNWRVTYTTAQDLYTYRLTETKLNNSLVLSPILNVGDYFAKVNLNDGNGLQTLTPNTNAFKQDSDKFTQGLGNTNTAGSLEVTPRLPITDSLQGQDLYDVSSRIAEHRCLVVYKDNVLQIPGTHYTYTTGGNYGFRIQFVTAPANNSVITYGFAYFSHFTSPLLSLVALSRTKKPKWCYVYFDNRDVRDRQLQGSVNSSSSQPNLEIYGQWKRRASANLAFVLESGMGDAEVIADMYQFPDLNYDESLFDLPSSKYQDRRFVVFKEMLFGGGNSYQLIVWNFDDAYFELVGYQVSQDVRAERYVEFVSTN
jgi:hypothetical protein